MKKSLSTVALVAATAVLSVQGCATEQTSTLEEGVSASGTAILALTSIANGRTYRLAGDVNVDYVLPSGASSHVETMHLDDQSGSVYVLTLRAGAYDITLQNVHLFRVDPSGDSEVTFSSSQVGVAQHIVVTAGGSTNLSWSFSVAGTVVSFDPCVPNANAVACATGDFDGDGVANGSECVNPTACVDTDHDGQPDVQDTDSDNDGYADGADSARLDACLPNAYATSCTAAATGTVNTNVSVEETCTATPPDTCSFGPNGGVTPPAIVPPAHTPTLPDVDPGSLSLLAGPGALPAGAFLTASYDPAAIAGGAVGVGSFVSAIYAKSVPFNPSSTSMYFLQVTVEGSNAGDALQFRSPNGGLNPVGFASAASPAFPSLQLVPMNATQGWVWVTFELTSPIATPPGPAPLARKTVAVRLN